MCACLCMDVILCVLLSLKPQNALAHRYEFATNDTAYYMMALIE